jgi:F-type H+-transporting ATPase subunit c
MKFAGNLLLQCEPGCTVSGNHLLAALHKEAVMKKQWMWMLMALVVVTLFAPAAFAQDSSAGSSKAISGIAVGFGMAIAAFGCGLAQGRIASAACEGMARNPGAAGAIRASMILGLVFVETLVLFTLAMIALKV